MSELFQFLKETFRDNFASAMFLVIVSIIALAFISYLVIDYVRMMKLLMRHKRQHRDRSNGNRS